MGSYGRGGPGLRAGRGGLVRDIVLPSRGLCGEGQDWRCVERCRGEVGRRAGTWRGHGLVIAVLRPGTVASCPDGVPLSPSRAGDGQQASVIGGSGALAGRGAPVP